jgi:uncharacterized circularly permuted ATP-grasp superfamily protein/uncharacterized alpha-E superfamily protein
MMPEASACPPDTETMPEETTQEAILSNYQRLPDSYDEMFTAEGEIRSHWKYFIDSLQKLGVNELERRWQEAHRLLRDNGVNYSDYYGSVKKNHRPWQLDPIPMLMSQQEWEHIERGLLQRAELMSLLFNDLYGDKESLRKGLLPIELIAGHPNFLRPCVGIKQIPRHRLPFYAVDLVRSPSGEIWAMADRTQMPAGAGYALENRLVMSRVLPSLFRDSHVHRLSLFFRTLRSTLASMSNRDDHRIVMLTAGDSYNGGSYFEDVYLAKYLGYTLVQGGDLTVREGKVCLKTLNGLQHVDVILRRINDNDCDPLELNQYSYVGVAGLLQSLRLGAVAMANPLGGSILENAGLLAFLPKLARYFLGEDLLINSPQTWWCGDKKSRDHVLANLDNLLIKQTVRNVHSTTIRSKLLSGKQRELLTEQILKHPHRYVGTEEVSHSSVPIFTNNRLEPRPVAMRTFITSTETGYMVMPGGLARVATGRDSPVVSARNIRISKDIWVTASAPEHLLNLSAATQQSPGHIVFEGQNELPSRVAENLFWLGRYAERAEGTIRLLRTVLLYLADPYDFPIQTQQPSVHNLLHNLLRAVTCLTETYPGFIGEGAAERLAQPESELRSIFLDKDRVGGLSSTLQFLVNVAGSIRERVSPDMWRVINRIDEQLQRLQGETKVDILPELDDLITALAAFSGLSVESMTHGQGWKFLIIGRRIERGQHLVDLLKTILCNVNEDDTAMMEHLLGITDSLLTYRRRYRSQPEAYAVLELVLQSERNPHAIGYQLERIERYIRELPGNTQIYCSPMGKILLEALTLIRLANMDTLAQVTTDPVAGDFRKELEQLLIKVGDLLVRLSDIVSNSYFTHAEIPRQLVKLASEAQDI